MKPGEILSVLTLTTMELSLPRNGPSIVQRKVHFVTVIALANIALALAKSRVAWTTAEVRATTAPIAVILIIVGGQPGAADQSTNTLPRCSCCSHPCTAVCSRNYASEVACGSYSYSYGGIYSYSYDDYSCPSDDLDVGIQQHRSAFAKEAMVRITSRCKAKFEKQEQDWRSSGMIPWHLRSAK